MFRDKAFFVMEIWYQSIKSLHFPRWVSGEVLYKSGLISAPPGNKIPLQSDNWSSKTSLSPIIGRYMGIPLAFAIHFE